MDKMSDANGGLPVCSSRMTKPVNFFCSAPRARKVYLTGDFNHWSKSGLPMCRQVDGWWFLQVPLCHGHHHYIFLVDGKPTLDPRATGVVHDEVMGDVSLLAVS